VGLNGRVHCCFIGILHSIPDDGGGSIIDWTGGGIGRTYGVGDNVAYVWTGMSKMPILSAPKGRGTARALATISRRRRCTASGVGVERGSKAVNGVW
jgi:hypothetical protein